MNNPHYRIAMIFVFLFFTGGCGGGGSSSNPSVKSTTEAIGDVTAEAGQGSITLQWGLAGGDVVACNVYIASEPEVTKDNYQTLQDGMKSQNSVSPFTIANLDSSKTYYIAIYAIINDVENGDSVSVSSQPLATTDSGGQDTTANSSGSSNRKTNIIFIVIDTTRADHLSTYGYLRNTSPYLSSFAASSYNFVNAISPSSWTLPSFASILTAKHAFNHNFNLPNSYDTTGSTFLHSYLETAGYKTVSIQRNMIPAALLRNAFNTKYVHISDEDYDSQAIDSAISYMGSRAAGENFFMFIGLLNPHVPYRVNNSYFARYVSNPSYSYQYYINLESIALPIYYSYLTPELQAILGEPPLGWYQDSRVYVAAYDGEINTTDYDINRFFEYLKTEGLYDDSLIVVTADHGEHMADHAPSFFEHGTSLYSALIHVPMIIKLPNQSAPKVIYDYVRTIDIMPTILDYVSIDTGDVDGISLLPVMSGTETIDYTKRPVLSYHVMGSEPAISVILNNYHLIKTKSGNVELYDWRTDSGDYVDISTSHASNVNNISLYLMNYFTKF